MRGGDGSAKSVSDASRATNGTSRNPVLKSRSRINSSSNGIADVNGHSSQHTNGVNASSRRPLASTFYGHDREEVTRILIQGLQDLGYQSSADALSRESQFELESPHVTSFKLAILAGEWAEAEALLNDHVEGPDMDHDVPEEQLNGTDTRHSARSRGLALSADASRTEMLFMIRQQKYLELLEQRDIPSALLVLRQELHPLHQEQRQLHALSSLIMCRSSEDLKNQAGWDGSLGESRKDLLSDLSHAISPSVMIPEHRLAVLFDQIKEYQALECQYHNSLTPPSLYADHSCQKEDFPMELHCELDQHSDEVWFVAFSNNGKQLATASRDKSVMIYDTSTFRVRHVLKEHKRSVAYVAWSPDDERLITCSQDFEARLWDMTTGRCVRVLKYHLDHVTTAAWAPDGRSFVTGSTDLIRPLSIWSSDNSIPETSPLYTFENSCNRVLDCTVAALAPSSQTLFSEDKDDSQSSRASGPQIRLAAICADRTVHVYDYVRREKLRHINFDHRLTSITMGTDGREMLINLESSEIWTIGVEDGEIRRKYRGLRQGEYVIRSCFGGATEGFVVSGDEDGAICVWHRHSGQLIEKIEGHKVDENQPACVNAVSWNSAKPSMFASASDDGRVRVYVARQQDE